MKAGSALGLRTHTLCRRRDLNLDDLPKIRRVKVAKKNPKFLTEEAIWKVLEAATPRTRWPIQLLAFTGIRKGELAHLEWSDIDFDNRLLRVQAKDRWMPKGNEDRTIPLTDGAMQALQALWEMNDAYSGELDQ